MYNGSSEYDLFEFLQDRAAYRAYLQDDAEDNAAFMHHLKKAAAVAIKRELTDVQREYLMLYFGDGYSMTEIAEIKGVAVSSVS